MGLFLFYAFFLAPIQTFLPFRLLIQKLFVLLQSIMVKTKDDYYIESKRIRNEVLTMAGALKGEPLRFTITNGMSSVIMIVLIFLLHLLVLTSKLFTLNVCLHVLLVWLSI